MIALVAPDRLAHEWPRVEAWIEDAVKVNQGDETLLDVLVALARGHYLLWAAPDYAVVAKIQRHPRQTVGVILYCGGSGLECMTQAFHDAKHWARAQGVDVIRTYGRRGWARSLGLDEVGVILQCKVDP